MNFKLGWRDVGITLFAIAQHFSLFTFHFSLPAGTLFTSVMQCGALALAVHCIGCRSVLRWASQRTVFSGAVLLLFSVMPLSAPFYPFL